MMYIATTTTTKEEFAGIVFVVVVCLTVLTFSRMTAGIRWTSIKGRLTEDGVGHSSPLTSLVFLVEQGSGRISLRSDYNI